MKEKQLRSRTLTRRDFMILSGATTAATLLPGCGSGNGAPQNKGVLRSGVVVLPNDGSLTISNITDTGLTLSGTVPALQAGSVIVSGTGNGLLRKVTSLTQNGGSTVLITQQAFMEELFLSAEFGLKKSLGPADFASIVTAPGVTLDTRAPSQRSLTLPFSFSNVKFTQNLGNGTSVSLAYSGVTAIVLDLDFQFVYDPAGLQRLRMVAIVGGSSDVTLTASGKVDISPITSQEFPYAVATGNPILILVPIGGVPVPVVIVPVLTLSAQFTTSIKAGLEVKATFNASARAGFDFKRGVGTDSILAFTPTGSLLPTANFFASLTAEMAIAKAKLSADIYALAGPFVGFKALSVEAELKTELVAPRSMAFTARAVQGGSAGLAAGSVLGATLPLIDVPLFDSKQEIFRKTFLPGAETVIVN
jgi:hypothetical protein